MAQRSAGDTRACWDQGTVLHSVSQYWRNARKWTFYGGLLLSCYCTAHDDILTTRRVVRTQRPAAWNGCLSIFTTTLPSQSCCKRNAERAVGTWEMPKLAFKLSLGILQRNWRFIVDAFVILLLQKLLLSLDKVTIGSSEQYFMLQTR